jgi:hypothetical protein
MKLEYTDKDANVKIIHQRLINANKILDNLKSRLQRLFLSSNKKMSDILGGWITYIKEKLIMPNYANMLEIQKILVNKM